MLTYFLDPRGILPHFSQPLEPTLTLLQNLKKHFPIGLDADLHSFIINGVEVDPLKFDLNRNVSTLDSVDIIRRQQGLDPISWAIIAAVSVAAAVAVTALTPKPRTPNDVGTTKESPNNRLTGQTNIARLYQAKPDIYGRRRVYPDLIGASITEYINNVKFVTEFMCIGTGNYAVSNIRYADNDLQQIDKSSYEIFNPGDVIPSIIDVFTSPEVDGAEIDPVRDSNAIVFDRTFEINFIPAGNYRQMSFSLKTSDLRELEKVTKPARAFVTYPRGWGYTSFKGFLTATVLNKGVQYLIFSNNSEFNDFGRGTPSPFVRVQIPGSVEYGPIILSKKLEQIWFNLVFPRGLKASVQLKAKWYKIDSDNQEIPGTREERLFNYSANTLEPRYYTEKVIPKAGVGEYAFAISRLTAETGDANPSQVKLETLAAVQVRKNVVAKDTLIRVTTKATEQATSYKDRKFNLVANRKVITYNRQTKQIDYTLKPHRSFADAILHEWVIVAKKDPARLNLDELYAIYDSLPDKRLGYFDFSFDDKDISLGERIQTICNAARVTCSKDGLQYRFVRNERKAHPRYQFDGRNLASSDSGGTLTFKMHEPSSFNGVELEYVRSRQDDPQHGTDKKAYIKLKIDTDTGAIGEGECSRPYKIQLAGCTNHLQAMNRAQFEIRQLLYSRLSVEDTALIDAVHLPIGSRVRYVDTSDRAVVSGEILSFENGVFTSSEEIILEHERQYKICITDKYGQPSDWISFELVDSYSFKANFNNVAIADNKKIQLGSRFIIATPESETLDFVITNKKAKSADSIDISLSVYDERVFEYDDKAVSFAIWSSNVNKRYKTA